VAVLSTTSPVIPVRGYEFGVTTRCTPSRTRCAAAGAPFHRLEEKPPTLESIYLAAMAGPVNLPSGEAGEQRRVGAGEGILLGRMLASLRGQVVVVHFWTFGCSNCIHNYPAYKTWQAKYAGKGATIIGIHTPEFDHEADVKKVRARAEQNGLKFPIAVDSGAKNWKNWKNRYWPTIYLIDKKGTIRFTQIGEGEYGPTQRMIETLLAERG